MAEQESSGLTSQSFRSWPGPVRGHGSQKRSAARTGLGAIGSLRVLGQVHSIGHFQPFTLPEIGRPTFTPTGARLTCPEQTVSRRPATEHRLENMQTGSVSTTAQTHHSIGPGCVAPSHPKRPLWLLVAFANLETRLFAD